jgi:hypothetical protein
MTRLFGNSNLFYIYEITFMIFILSINVKKGAMMIAPFSLVIIDYLG